MRPITICTTVKTWLSQRSLIWPQCDVRHEEINTNKGSRIIYITEKAAHQCVQIEFLGYSQQFSCLG